MIVSTLCYLERDGQYLMLLRNKKKNDVNEGKWIAPGGKAEAGESPEECVSREVYEETGLSVHKLRMRGILTFSSEGWEDEYIFVFTSDSFSGELIECDEGRLEWIDKKEIPSLNLWEGDRIFLKMLIDDEPFFSLKLSYKWDELVEKKVNTYSLRL